MQFDTTIAAVATAPLNAALGVVRLSGPQALAIASCLFSPAAKPLIPGRASLRRLFFKGLLLDEAVATFHQAPASFTGEDTVELSCHGGVQVLGAVLEALLQAGATPAAPGEYSKRAFLNGKLDLAQAEAVIDLIEAGSRQSAALATCQLEGALSRKLTAIRQVLLDVCGQIMAVIDYPDEEIDELAREQLVSVTGEALSRCRALLETYPLGSAIRNGIPAAIIGKPNVGKSSLMNLLAGYDRSIVTEIPGTTRDVLTESVSIGRLTLHFSDTAGIRASEDVVEQLGVRRSLESASEASLLLCVFDSSRPLEEEDRQILELAAGKNSFAILNISDLPRRLEELPAQLFAGQISLCAKTGAGRDRLVGALEQLFAQGMEPGDLLITSARHRDCLYRAVHALVQATDTLAQGAEPDLAEIDLRDAIGALGEITGQNASQDILNNIFSRFCVGK